MTREQAIEDFMAQNAFICDANTLGSKETLERNLLAIKALQAWDKFKQALDKRILEQGFDENEWSVSYNELIKMMKKSGGVE